MGKREILLIALVSGGVFAMGLAGLAQGSLWCLPAIMAFALLCGTLLFFRDPDRSPPSSPGLFVAPADGRVTDIHYTACDPVVGGPAMCIGIFLSILDVHVNRSPCSGVVLSVDYQPGQFRDARDARSGQVNEANTIVIKPDDSGINAVAVRQIAGKIARRIVCLVQPGDHVERGQRIGMIKFGSRTELILAGEDVYEPFVEVGDRASGGVTVLADAGGCTAGPQGSSADICVLVNLD